MNKNEINKVTEKIMQEFETLVPLNDIDALVILRRVIGCNLRAAQSEGRKAVTVKLTEEQIDQMKKYFILCERLIVKDVRDDLDYAKQIGGQECFREAADQIRKYATEHQECLQVARIVQEELYNV